MFQQEEWERRNTPKLPGGVQGQVGWGPGQPGLVNGKVGGSAWQGGLEIHDP